MTRLHQGQNQSQCMLGVFLDLVLLPDSLGCSAVRLSSSAIGGNCLGLCCVCGLLSWLSMQFSWYTPQGNIRFLCQAEPERRGVSPSAVNMLQTLPSIRQRFASHQPSCSLSLLFQRGRYRETSQRLTNKIAMPIIAVTVSRNARSRSPFGAETSGTAGCVRQVVDQELP